MPKKEYMNKYIREGIPRKRYIKKGFYLRDRRPYELFWSEVIIAIVILLMVLLVYINSLEVSTGNEAKAEQEKIINVDVGIEEENSEAKGEMEGGIEDIGTIS